MPTKKRDLYEVENYHIAKYDLRYFRVFNKGGREAERLSEI